MTRCGLQTALVVLLLSAAAHASSPFSPDAFPNPKVDLQACGRDGVASNICDPDLLLSARSKDYVEGLIKSIWSGEPPFTTADCAGKPAGYQVRSSAAATCPPPARHVAPLHLLTATLLAAPCRSPSR
jgi:hypothetical protein